MIPGHMGGFGSDGVVEPGAGESKQEREHLLPWAVVSEHRELLAKIDELGSVAGAARAIGLSYKEAWDTINAINNLAGKVLVYRLSIGRPDGVTLLSDEGKHILKQAVKAMAKRNRL